MSVEYTITREQNRTEIERRVGIAVQHYVLWDRSVGQLVSIEFGDGVTVRHVDEVTYYYDPRNYYPETLRIGDSIIVEIS